MTHKVYVVTDLGPGDGGKGGVVHKIATMMRAHTIIKKGGAQGSHGVRTSKGEQFAFSQWGCGTFEGIPTHLSGKMVISPEGILNEAAALRYEHGIGNPFDLLTADQTALCATPFHGIASRLKELARGNSPRGTIGTGVGEAYRDFGRLPDLAITARDLTGPGLRDQLAAIRDQVRLDLQPIVGGAFLAIDREAMEEEVQLLYDDGFLDYVVGRFEEAGKYTRIVGSDFLREDILSKEGVAVVETSHGILTDRVMGFHPHTSAIRTLPRFTHGIFEDAGYEGELVNLGITRAYAIRHGAGPMPTANPDLAERLLPDSNKDENRYQGKVRVGPLDLVLLRYAIAACGGPTAFDGLAITWFDQIQTNQKWSICNQYNGPSDPLFFTPSGEIKVDPSPTLERQTALTVALNDCDPELTTIPLKSTDSREQLYGACAAVLADTVNIPVRMVSFGPTELDKLCK
jgi:adenylosuccinate synthase